MRLYSSAYLAFGVRIDYGLKEFLEGDELRAFNAANCADLGYLTAGSFGDEDLYLVTYCESANPDESNIIRLRGISRKGLTVQKRQIEKFLREQNITPLDDIALRLMADLDN